MKHLKEMLAESMTKDYKSIQNKLKAIVPAFIKSPKEAPKFRDNKNFQTAVKLAKSVCDNLVNLTDEEIYDLLACFIGHCVRCVKDDNFMLSDDVERWMEAVGYNVDKDEQSALDFMNGLYDAAYDIYKVNVGEYFE